MPTAQTMAQWLVDLVVDRSRAPYDITAPASADTLFTAEQAGLLYRFLAPYLEQGMVGLEGDLPDRVLVFFALAAAEELAKDVRDREARLFALVKAFEGRFDLAALTKLAYQKHLYTLALKLAEQQRDFALMLECSLADDRLRPALFGYVRSWLRRPFFEGRDRFLATLTAFLPRLVPVDTAQVGSPVPQPTRAPLAGAVLWFRVSELVCETFRDEDPRLVGLLRPFPPVLFAYLRGVIQAKSRPALPTAHCPRPTAPGPLPPAHCPGPLPPAHCPRPTAPGPLPPAHCPRPTAPGPLPCTPHPAYEFLSSNGNMRFDMALVTDLCVRKKAALCIAYLRERVGDNQGALRAVVESLGAQADQVDGFLVATGPAAKEALVADPPGLALFCRTNDIRPRGPTASPEEEHIACTQALSRAVDAFDSHFTADRAMETALPADLPLCARNEELWLSLLECVAARHRAQKFADLPQVVATRLHRVLGFCVAGLIQHMHGLVSLPHLLGRVLETHAGEPFQAFREIILGILERQRFEASLLRTATQLVSQNTHDVVDRWCRSRRRAIAVQQTATCCVCGEPVAPSDEAQLAAAAVAHRSSTLVPHRLSSSHLIGGGAGWVVGSSWSSTAATRCTSPASLRWSAAPHAGPLETEKERRERERVERAIRDRAETVPVSEYQPRQDPWEGPVRQLETSRVNGQLSDRAMARNSCELAVLLAPE
ncbi:putative vacuolar protein sorting-associated protein 8 [Paratrimastix pyriformis]|uniref:Vacuolar protein sorting-associated protein 8 n=1 Tax=Paratrimastix pyriformis TaxID=342808 RepID=A0ABQ8ULM2_9EUKA|nr:putative vacuolar protein sorting-associated protein 8 [Paratrimastix pyriformis]